MFERVLMSAMTDELEKLAGENTKRNAAVGAGIGTLGGLNAHQFLQSLEVTKRGRKIPTHRLGRALVAGGALTGGVLGALLEDGSKAKLEKRALNSRLTRVYKRAVKGGNLRALEDFADMTGPMWRAGDQEKLMRHHQGQLASKEFAKGGPLARLKGALHAAGGARIRQSEKPDTKRFMRSNLQAGSRLWNFGHKDREGLLRMYGVNKPRGK